MCCTEFRESGLYCNSTAWVEWIDRQRNSGIVSFVTRWLGLTTLHSSYQAGRYIQDKRKKQRGVGKRACHKDGLMDSRQLQASQISSGGRPGQAQQCAFFRADNSGVRMVIHGVLAAMCACWFENSWKNEIVFLSRSAFCFELWV